MGGLHASGAETKKTALVFKAESTMRGQLLEISLAPEELAKHFTEGGELMETRVHLDETGEVLPYVIRFVMDRTAFLNQAPPNTFLNELAKANGSSMQWFGTVIAFKLSQTYYNHVSMSRSRNIPVEIQNVLTNVRGLRAVRGHGFERYRPVEFLMQPPNRASTSGIASTSETLMHGTPGGSSGDISGGSSPLPQ